jgi:Domain of unknown function (DUF4267)
MAIASNSAYFMGTAATAVGLLSLFAPLQAAEVFGVPFVASPSSSNPSPSPPNSAAIAFLAAKGARDLTLGVAYFALGYQGNFSAVRVLMFAHALTGAVDAGVVSRFGIGRKAWGHGVGTVGMVLWLLNGFVG